MKFRIQLNNYKALIINNSEITFGSKPKYNKIL